MKLSSHFAPEFPYQWTYNLSGINFTCRLWSNLPHPTAPGLYLTEFKGRPFIFHLVSIEDNEMVVAINLPIKTLINRLLRLK